MRTLNGIGSPVFQFRVRATLAGASTAGAAFRVDAMTTGRLSGDTLGTMRNGPGAVAGYTTSSTAYNPPGDSGPGRRWGDYSFTSLDPIDDMTMWTVQEYCNGTNTYGARVAQLKAPPPANIADGPNSGLYDVAAGMASVNVTITGTSVSGSGFYDPGANLPAACGSLQSHLGVGQRLKCDGQQRHLYRPYTYYS